MTFAPEPRRRLRQLVIGVVILGVVTGAVGGAAIATDTLGMGGHWQGLLNRIDRFITGPVPDRPTLATVLVTPPPSSTPSPTTKATASRRPGASATAVPTPSPPPHRVSVDVNVVQNPNAVFKTEIHKDWCAAAGVQIVLAQFGLADTSDATQGKIADQVRTWESYADSHNGAWGPAAMALALKAYGAPGYQIRAFDSRMDALRDAAKAIETTGSPAILLAWTGAHTWVMSGFRADADPAVFDDAKIFGTYILDPWYPRISSIWGPSDPPGTFQDWSEMVRNFLPWKRPEGRYPDRDGLFITVVPTLPPPNG